MQRTFIILKNKNKPRKENFENLIWIFLKTLFNEKEMLNRFIRQLFPTKPSNQEPTTLNLNNLKTKIGYIGSE